MNGLFIALEGPEGAGKSTLARHLAEALRSRAAGRAGKVLLTREPGGTPVSDAIRSVLLDPGQRISPLTEFLLYSASRAQHVEDVIRPALAAGSLVISDRFTGSSLAYQGAGRGLDAEFVTALSERVTGDCVPDVTVLVDIDTEAGLARIRSRGSADRLEQADAAFHQRVADSFRAQAEQYGWLTVDGSLPQEQVTELVLSGLAERLDRWFAV